MLTRSAVPYAIGAFLLAACPGKQTRVASPPALVEEPPAVAVPVLDALACSYECTLEFEGKKRTGPCQVQVGDGSHRFTLSLQSMTVEGDAHATDYGFHLIGALEGATGAGALHAEIMKQGGGGFAGVLNLASGRFAKLTLVRSPDC